MNVCGYGPKDLLTSFVVNCVAGAIPGVFLLMLHVPTRPEAVLNSLLMGVVFANTIGFPARFVIPQLYPGVARRGPVWEWSAVALVLVGLGIVGCLLGTAILAMMHRLPWSRYWISVRGNLLLCIMITLAFGLVLNAFGRMQGRLQRQELERERALKLASEAQLASLESRIHPHFLFNTMNSISALIPVDPVRAERLMERMAALLRFSLDAHSHGLVLLEQEMKIVSDYLEIEQARLGSRLRYQVDFVDSPGLRIPPLAVQTLVENSIKHAIAPDRQGGEIRVRTSQSEGQMRIEVADTGPGFAMEDATGGHGLDNLRNRLNVLFGGMAGLSVTRHDGWTTVTLVIPI